MPEPSSRGPRRLAAVLTGVQALALAGFAAYYVVELLLGEGSDAGRVIMSAVLILLGAVGLGALTRGWIGAGAWPCTPTLVWNVLLLPVGVSLVQGTRVAIGWVVIVVALLAIIAAWLAREPDAEVLPDGDVPR